MHMRFPFFVTSGSILDSLIFPVVLKWVRLWGSDPALTKQSWVNLLSPVDLHLYPLWFAKNTLPALRSILILIVITWLGLLNQLKAHRTFAACTLVQYAYSLKLSSGRMFLLTFPNLRSLYREMWQTYHDNSTAPATSFSLFSCICPRWYEELDTCFAVRSLGKKTTG